MKNSTDLSAREDMTQQQFFDAYYSNSGIDSSLVAELLCHLATELSLPVAKLRPQDRFAVELSPRKGDEWDSGYGILMYELNHLARIKNVKIHQEVATIDDYIKVMSGVY